MEDHCGYGVGPWRSLLVLVGAFVAGYMCGIQATPRYHNAWGIGSHNLVFLHVLVSGITMVFTQMLKWGV